MDTRDRGPEPYVTDVETITLKNHNYRTTKWTGSFLQMTVMSIPVGGEVGLEVHPETDQFLRIEQGRARVLMGPAEDDLGFDEPAREDDAILVPAGTWHNVVNAGDEDLKLYSLYAPPHHPHSTVQETYEIAMRDEGD
ncbi:MAG: cupin domain-containing protein [Acidimicrobiia bacterium]|nr:cupin domain-containing protein [Acidimicrobiia bacterium]